MAHFIEYCQYGFLHRQCRCPGGTKTIKKCSRPDKHSAIRRTAWDWLALHKVHILDPDGWRDGVDFDTPITLENFIERVSLSTIKMLDRRLFDW